MAVQIMSSPRKVDIAITGRCNLDCQYCYFSDEMTVRTDLPTELWLSFFTELGEMGVMDVCLTGGELFTRKDIFELIDGIVANRMRYQILTNATLITEEVITRLNLEKRRKRLNLIQVSIDGSRAEVHNLSRPNSFERSVRGLVRLKEAGFPLTVRVTVNRQNLEDLENIVKFLLEEIGIPWISTNEVAPIGAGCRNAYGVGLTPLEQVVAMQTFSRLLQKYPGRMIASAGPQAKILAHSEMEHARATGEKTSRWQMGSLSGCNCVFSNISVMHDGSITPCLLLYGVVLGNIIKDSLKNIWQDHPTLIALRERRNISMHTVSGCEECEWADYCNGNCPAIAYQLTGDFNRASPYDCYRQFLLDTQLTNEITG